MSQSPFAFFRGSAIVQAHDLLSTPVSGPIVQLCGDCHVLNFGGFATPERNLIFDINDFDETFPGPWEWDLKRLTASIVLAARDRSFSKAVARDAALAAVASYRAKMAEYAQLSALELWYSRLLFTDLATFFDRNREVLGTLPAVEKYALKRTSESIFPKLTTVADGHLKIVDDPPLIFHFQVAEAEAAIRAFFAQYRSTLVADRQLLFDRYVLQDMAVKVVGVGSVGTRCAIALFMSDGVHPLFLQIKEARRSVLEPPDAQQSRYAHQGERVVYGQRLMQAASDIFLGWAETVDARDYYVRQLRDMKVSVNLERFRSSTLVDYAAVCGWTLARAHAKSGDAATLAGYLGKKDTFDRALADYAAAYADQVERDYAEFMAAIHDGRISTDASDVPLDFTP